MFGLILLFFIGKYYYKLAEQFNKSKVGFAILGVVLYYAGTIVFGLAFGLIAEVVSPGYIDTINEYALGLLSVPFGLITCFLIYKYLKKQWQKSSSANVDIINEIGKTE